jgi:Arc/MetJ-type ribon-helix-helix transcriptional regulator
MENITTYIPEIFDKNINELKEKGFLISRSQVIRDALAEYIKQLENDLKLLKFERGKDMKIVSANIPEEYLEAIKELIGKDGIYPSRSELIRCAVRKFLIDKLKMLKRLESFDQGTEEDGENEEDGEYVKIPIEDDTKKSEVREFKTYKILRRLT